MKRLFILVFVTVLTFLLLGLLRAKENATLNTIASLRMRQVELAHGIAQQEADQAALRRIISAQKAQRALTDVEPRFSPALLSWLLASNHANIPDKLIPELRTSLDLPIDASSDFVLVSKPSLRVLRPSAPGRNDKLPDSLSGLLSLSVEQRQQVEAALSSARHEFADWAKQNLQREGPQGDTLVRYTIPQAEGGSDSITNRLMANLSEVLGPERTEQFYRLADSWFEIENGYLGGVTNTLSVLRRTGRDGQPALFYHLTRAGEHSSMGEGPGPIRSQFFPPAWRNVFPEGWAEVAQREGFELPPAGTDSSK
jgi:hypothetical protein